MQELHGKDGKPSRGCCEIIRLDAPCWFQRRQRASTRPSIHPPIQLLQLRRAAGPSVTRLKVQLGKPRHIRINWQEDEVVLSAFKVTGDGYKETNPNPWALMGSLQRTSAACNFNRPLIFDRKKNRRHIIDIPTWGTAAAHWWSLETVSNINIFLQQSEFY